MRINHVIKTDQWRCAPQIRPASHFVVSHFWRVLLTFGMVYLAVISFISCQFKPFHHLHLPSLCLSARKASMQRLHLALSCTMILGCSHNLHPTIHGSPLCGSGSSSPHSPVGHPLDCRRAFHQLNTFFLNVSYLQCALSCAVYCNRPCLFVCLFVCVCVCGSALLQSARSVCVASGRFFPFLLLVFYDLLSVVHLLCAQLWFYVGAWAAT